MVAFVYVENEDEQGLEIARELLPLQGSFVRLNPRYFEVPERTATQVYVRSLYAELIEAYDRIGVPITLLDEKTSPKAKRARREKTETVSLPAAAGQPAVVDEPPVNVFTSDEFLEPASEALGTLSYVLRPRGDGFGWWDVVEESSGQVVNEDALRRNDAESLRQQLMGV